MIETKVQAEPVCADCGTDDAIWFFEFAAHLCVPCIAARWRAKATTPPTPLDDEVDDEFGYFRRRRRLWPKRR